MTDKADWLAGLKVGDPVMVHSTYPDVCCGQRIARFTKMFIILDDGRRFRRKSGDVPGNDPWHICWIEKPTRTQARKAKARKAER